MGNKTEEPLKILVLEDNEADIFLIRHCLLNKFHSAVIEYYNNFSDASSIISQGLFVPEVIILDLSLTDYSNEDLIERVLSFGLDTLIIVLTGNNNFELGVRSVAMGVSDYLLKDDLSPFNLYKSIIYSMERKKRLLELKKLKEDFSNLFYSSPSAAWILDIDTCCIIDCNMVALEIFGYFADTFAGQNFEKLIAKDDFERFSNALNEYDKTRSFSFSGLVNFVDSTQQNITTELQSSVVNYNDKEVILMHANDKTGILKTLSKLEDQNKMLREIAWEQSHSVRAPLARILGLCQLLESMDEMKDNTEAKKMVNFLMQSSQDLDNVIKKIISKSAYFDRSASVNIS